jgi:hypothetical protein
MLNNFSPCDKAKFMLPEAVSATMHSQCLTTKQPLVDMVDINLTNCHYRRVESSSGGAL